jgi:MFS family permease
MLPGAQLPAANSLNMTVFQLGAIIGPMLAGVLLKWVDLSTLYLIDAVTCIAPIWATFRLSPMPATGADAEGPPRWGFRAVLDGFRYLAGNTVVLMSFVVDIIAMVFGMPRALFPQIAHQSFGGPVGGGTTMALLAAAISIGAVAGGVFSGWLPRVRRQGLVVVIAIVVWGLAMVGFGVSSGLANGRTGTMLWGAVVCLAIGGAADMVPAAFRSTILQQAASDDVRGRLQGVFTVVVAGGPRLADAAHGGAAAVVGTTIAAAVGGVLVVIGVVIAALAVPAFVRYSVVSPDRRKKFVLCSPEVPVRSAVLARRAQYCRVVESVKGLGMAENSRAYNSVWQLRGDAWCRLEEGRGPADAANDPRQAEGAVHGRLQRSADPADSPRTVLGVSGISTVRKDPAALQLGQL